MFDYSMDIQLSLWMIASGEKGSLRAVLCVAYHLSMSGKPSGFSLQSLKYILKLAATNG